MRTKKYISVFCRVLKFTRDELNLRLKWRYLKKSKLNLQAGNAKTLNAKLFFITNLGDRNFFETVIQ